MVWWGPRFGPLLPGREWKPRNVVACPLLMLPLSSCQGSGLASSGRRPLYCRKVWGATNSFSGCRLDHSGLSPPLSQKETLATSGNLRQDPLPVPTEQCSFLGIPD